MHMILLCIAEYQSIIKVNDNTENQVNQKKLDSLPSKIYLGHL